MGGDLHFVTNIFNELSYDDLLKCREKLDSAISKSFNEKQKVLHSHAPGDYISYEEDFVISNSVEYAGICSELESLHMKPQRESPDTLWLTNTNMSYTWESLAGNVTVKHPTDISKYPFIKQAMEDINHKFNINMNSCLINYYKSGNSRVRYHDDNEDDMDQTEPICILSIGSKRTVDFLYQDQDYRSRPVHSISPVDGSLYTMKSGCQQIFKHRVKKDTRVTSDRYCLSFRRRKTVEEETTPTPAEPGNISSPVKRMIQQLESGTFSPPTSDLTIDPKEHKSSPPPHEHKSSPPPQNEKPQSRATREKSKNTTVLFGTSITSRIDGPQLATRGRKVINISQSGAKIRDIKRNMEFFHANNSAAPYVDKIVFSFGTNDIKYSRRGVLHLKQVIIDLVLTAKSLFPGCIILIQCCLPIKDAYWYTCNNVLSFNRLLSNICSNFNCIYIDCFRYFLSPDGSDSNYHLYYDWLHLNNVGLGVLARCLSTVVNRRSYNHVFNEFGLDNQA